VHGARAVPTLSPQQATYALSRSLPRWAPKTMRRRRPSVLVAVRDREMLRGIGR